MAKSATENSAFTEQLMEEVCDRENLERAWKRVQRNKGSPGVDGVTIDDAKAFLRKHWPNIRSQLLDGNYQPQPVKRVEIPKPDGGVRKLGVPRVVDRLIQQVVLQVLQERWDPTFSEHSYGFWPGRSAHQAVAQAQRYIADGYNVVVDLDLEKFFDRVNHDILMARVAARIPDKRVLRLIRAFLIAGVMEDGLVKSVDEGTRQGGPLSPFLSNIVLDDLDKELARRGHRFCRYADDCNIYVRSHRAGERVMASIWSFAASASRSSPHRSLPVHRRDSGACLDTRRFNTHYEITYSTLLVFPESMCLCQLNSIEPPWYGPVCPVVWEGRRRETPPYPDH